MHYLILYSLLLGAMGSVFASGEDWDECQGIGGAGHSVESLNSSAVSFLPGGGEQNAEAQSKHRKLADKADESEGLEQAKNGLKAISTPFLNADKLALSLHTATCQNLFKEEVGVDNLTKVADRYLRGDIVSFIFEPRVQLQDEKGEVIVPVNSQHYFDTIPWTSWLRSTLKWFGNPWAWWDASQYNLTRNQCSIEMNVGIPLIKVRGANKDWSYINSQVRQYLLQTNWTARWFYPYVTEDTSYIVRFAIRRRFLELEKPALESVGFVNIRLIRDVHPVTGRLQWMIQATKR